ncbi:MAG: DUF4340 domain-containing protein [Elusimicrobiota bacterium]|nr:DUF4340 domain-containing protein [Elusimicrobiota bacterium]
MNRRLSFILGILVLLAVIHHFIKNASPEITPFAKIKEIRVIEVENMASKDKFCFIKSTGGWEIITSTNYPAAFRRVRVLMAEIKKLKFETVISFSENKRFENDLSSSSAIKLTVTGKKAVSILIGKQAFDRNHFYAGFENDEKSYLAGGLRKELLLTGADYYRNRILSSTKEEDTAILKIKGGKKTYSVLRSSSGWNFRGNMPEDFYKTIAYCLNMKSSGFYDKRFNATHTIEIVAKDGGKIVWEFGKTGKNKFCARVPGKNGGYIIPTEKAKKIIKFFKKNTP